MGVPTFGPSSSGGNYNGVPGNEQAVPLSNGNYFFVDSDNGSDGYPGTASQPLATLNRALALCLDNNGDVIVLCPHHKETISTAGGVNVAVVGVTIVGLGNGRNRPTFTFSTSTAATFIISGSAVSVSNIVGITTVDQIVSPFVVTGSGVILSFEWQDGSAILEALRAVLTSATANRLRLNLLYNGFTAGSHGVNAVRLVGGSQAQVNINYYGICTTGVVEFATTAVVDAQITGFFYNGTTAITKDVVDTITGSTWAVQGFDGVAGNTFDGGSGRTPASSDVSSITAVQESAVATGSAVMTNGLSLFTIAGGPIEIMYLVSLCQTANGATASTLQYSSTGTLGTTTQTISGASASLANAAAGTSIVFQGTALATAPLVNANSANIAAANDSVFVPAGSITAVIGTGSTTGTWKHYLRYKPLASGVTVTNAF